MTTIASRVRKAPAVSLATGLAGQPVTVSFAVSGAIQALNVVTGVLLARVLGPHGRGELAAVILWPSVLAAVGSLGMQDATTYHAARGSWPLSTLVGSTLAITVAQAGLLLLAGAALLPFVLSHYDATTRQTAYLYLAFIPINLFTLALMAVLNGRQRLHWFQGLRLLVIIGSAAAVMVLAAMRALTIQSVAIAFLAANFSVGLAAAVLVWRLGVARPRPSSRAARQLLRFGFQSHLGATSSLLNERLDQLLISVFLAPVQLGLYVIAVTMSSLASLVGSSVSMVALPAVAGLESGAAQRAAARRFAQLTLGVSVAVTIPMVLFAPALIQLFFGAAYRDAADVSRVLLVAAVALSSGRVIGTLLRAVGRPLDAGIGEVVALGVTVVGLAALLPMLGIMGAAVASLVAYSVSMAWTARRAARALDFSISSLLLPSRDDVDHLIRWITRSPEAPVENLAGDGRG